MREWDQRAVVIWLYDNDFSDAVPLFSLSKINGLGLVELTDRKLASILVCYYCTCVCVFCPFYCFELKCEFD